MEAKEDELLREASMERLEQEWDNPEDAVYDDWRRMYAPGEIGCCQRCGAVAAGRRQWMFHQQSAPAREFYCDRCLGVLRIYSIIGLGLLIALTGGLFIAAWWIGAFR